MTIHQSKGLEFDAVILPELNYPLLRPYFSSIVEKRDNPFSPPSAISRFPDKALRQLEPRLKQMHRESAGNIIKEELSVLYVAMTRAKHALYCITSPPPSKSQTLSASSIVRSALLKGEEEFLEWGERDWWNGLSRDSDSTKMRNKSIPLKMGKKIEKKLSKKARRYPIINPSSNLYQNKENAKNLLNIHNREAKIKGAAIHHLLAQISWLEEGKIEKFECKKLLEGFHLNDKTHRAVVEKFSSIIKSSNLSSIFSKQHYNKLGELQLYRELPFTVFAEDKLINGQFDRVLTIKNVGEPLEVIIFEYKTHEISDDSQKEELLEKSSRQVDLYKSSAASYFSTNKENISLKIVLTELEEIICSKS